MDAGTAMGCEGSCVWKSVTRRETVKMGWFASMLFGNMIAIDQCSDSLMFASLYGYEELDRKYKEAVVCVSANKFQIQAVHISDDVKISNIRRHRILRVPA